jgi:hypothetical protein
MLQPLVDIHRIGADAYSYRISARGAPACGEGAVFPSLACCLLDVGDSLGEYFARVQIRFEGLVLGTCATEVLRRLPQQVAERLERSHEQWCPAA